MPKKEKWINHPWTIAIGSVILTLVGTSIYDYLKQIPFLTTLWTFIKWLANVTWRFLNLNLKLWLVATIFILYKIVKHWLSRENKEVIKSYDYTIYTEDIIKGWKWTWDWEFQGSKYGISRLRVHCPACDTPMAYGIDFSGAIKSYQCPRCEYKSNGIPCDDPEIVKRLIDDNIRRKIEALAKQKES